MKANTYVWVGIRNIGTSDTPLYFDGQMIESLNWLGRQLAAMYMKNGIKIYFGRTKDEVQAGLDLKRGMSTKRTEELSSMLESLTGAFAHDSDAEGSVARETNEPASPESINESAEHLSQLVDPSDDYEPGAVK